MIVFIAKKFDSRKVGEKLDLQESTANVLLKSGIVSTEPAESAEPTEENKLSENKATPEAKKTAKNKK